MSQDPQSSPQTSPQTASDESQDETRELQIEVGRESVRVVTRGGAKFLAEVYVHRASDLHPGSETLLDRLNHPRERFLPCRVGGREELLHLAQIAMIEQDRKPPELETLDELGAQRAAAEIELVTGQTLRGEFVYLAPAERSRISDVLNRVQGTFLLMTTGETSRYVHRGAIVRVRF